MPNKKNRKRAGIASVVLTLLIALPQLLQRPAPHWIVIPVLVATCWLVLYSFWEWITNPKLTGIETVGHFLLVFVIAGGTLIAFGMWLTPDTYNIEVEYRIIGTPGHVTGFWLFQQTASGCSLLPATDVLFLAITNTQSKRSLISGYALLDNGAPIPRLDMRHGRLLFMTNLGDKPKGGEWCPPSRNIDFPSPFGIGSLVRFDPQLPDTGHACLVNGPFLDENLSGKYVASQETIRGWVFLQRQSPALLTLDTEIKEAAGDKYTYRVEPHTGNPNADVLSRPMTAEGALDLSQCAIRQP